MFITIQPLLTSLLQDPSFAVAHVNMLTVTNVRVNPTADTLWRYIELLEGELNDKALEEQQRNMSKPQAHLNELPQDALGIRMGEKGKGKDKDKKGRGGKDYGGKSGGKPKGGVAIPLEQKGVEPPTEVAHMVGGRSSSDQPTCLLVPGGLIRLNQLFDSVRRQPQIPQGMFTLGGLRAGGEGHQRPSLYSIVAVGKQYM
eukprot:1623535-Amphidinium_carterae.2